MSEAPWPDPTPVLVVAAMPEEIRPLSKRFSARRLPALGHLQVDSGTTGMAEIFFACTGEGSTAARSGMKALCEEFRPELVCAIGVAGGLTDELEVGDVIHARGLTTQTGERVSARIADDLASTAQRCGAVAGTVVTAPHIVWRAEDKRELGRKAGPHSVVDLESAAYAVAAGECNVPVAVFRAVSDPVSVSLPFDLDRCRDASGRIDRAAMIRYALTHPWIVPGLRRLQRNTQQACERLSQVVGDTLIGAYQVSQLDKKR